MNAFKQSIAASFSRSAPQYDQVATLQRQVADQLLNGLPIQCAEQPIERILDIGTGTGYGLVALRHRYPQTGLIGLDLAEGMLTFTASQLTFLDTSQDRELKIHLICGDAEALPLADNSVDLIYSSLSVQWCRDYAALFAECQRVLRPGGELHMSTLGPQSLWQLRQAWAEIDEQQHVNQFLSLKELHHHRGSLRVLSQHSKNIQLAYRDMATLLKALKTLGASVVEERSAMGLGGRERFAALEQTYQIYLRSDGQLPLDYEVYFLSWRKE